MSGRIEEMAAMMAKVGVGLLALPLAELPAIAHVDVRHRPGEGLRVELQLATNRARAAALWRWAEALPERAAVGQEFDDYIRIEVTGVIDGVRVAVWDHIDGEHLIDAGCVLSLPLDRKPHRFPLGALRGLAERQAVTTDA